MQNIINILLSLLCLWSCQNHPLPKDSDETNIEIMDSLKIDYIMGHFNPRDHNDFSEIPIEYADRAGLYIRTEVLEAFIKMYDHAAADDIHYTIRSATRNFDYQKGIWERKWTGKTQLSDGSSAADISSEINRAKKILLYSSMPGTSRHHWGTDIDLNSFDNDYFSIGAGLIEYQWLQEHAHSYGFCQTYTDKSNGRAGYEEEKWHWTYTPISNELTDYAQKFLRDDMIKGFLGAETAPEIEIVKNYVLGINHKCLSQ